MNKKNEIQLLEPQDQLTLFGYKKYFNSLKVLFERKKLPKVILLNGPKGSGKSTFSYHFINYLLSHNEDDSYNIDNFNISEKNSSYKKICHYTHPNFFLLKNNLLEENIKIEQIRSLLVFLNKSTYSKNLKIVLIDNAEYLNINSSNAILKSLEEPKDNTFFFIINDSANSVPETIKSRCVEFKIFLNSLEKKEIFYHLAKQYNMSVNPNIIEDDIYFNSPGNLIKFLSLQYNFSLDVFNDKLSSIIYLIEKYKSKKDFELLYLASLFIERFYNDLASNNLNKLNYYFFNKNKIINEINNMKKFNLDKKNLLIFIEGLLKNEK